LKKKKKIQIDLNVSLFNLDKIELFIKEWNKWGMWSQLGWPRQECLISGDSVPLVLQSLELNPLTASVKKKKHAQFFFFLKKKKKTYNFCFSFF